MTAGAKKLEGILRPLLEERAPGSVTGTLLGRDELYLRVLPGKLTDLCLFLRDDGRLKFDFLALVSGVDWLERAPRFEVVYHLRSLSKVYRLGLKVDVPDDTLSVPSLAGIYKTADWLEREVYDLYGVRFTDHPNLTRIMMPDDWEGHPYRRDYPLEGY